jgi:hypothetical protein
MFPFLLDWSTDNQAGKLLVHSYFTQDVVPHFWYVLHEAQGIPIEINDEDIISSFTIEPAIPQ